VSRARPLVRTCYVAFATQGAAPVTVAAKLALPPGERLGAVVICHGSDGVDGRGEFYAPTLRALGLATLELDMWSARGTTRGAAARPRSPIETVPDVFAALRFLAAQPEIDPARIGIMGFSWGAVVSLLAATRRFSDAGRGDLPAFAAHAAHYPVCWAYAKVPALALDDLTGAPILIQTGEADDYDAPGAGEALAASLLVAGATDVRAVAYPGAGHGFDRDLPAQTIVDPFAHQGAGGPVLMAFDPAAARAARAEVRRFFARALKHKGEVR
jgi:dienelactone hydrolase